MSCLQYNFVYTYYVCIKTLSLANDHFNWCKNVFLARFKNSLDSNSLVFNDSVIECIYLPQCQSYYLLNFSVTACTIKSSLQIISSNYDIWKFGWHCMSRYAFLVHIKVLQILPSLYGSKQLRNMSSKIQNQLSSLDLCQWFYSFAAEIHVMERN